MKLQTLREQFQTDYDFVLWLIIIFLGASVNTIILQTIGSNFFALLAQIESQMTDIEIAKQLAETEKQNPIPQLDPNLVMMFISSVALFAFLPIMISLIATKRMPQKQLVPPLFLQIITGAYFVFYFALSSGELIPKLASLALVGVYIAYAGFAQDRLMIVLLGRAIKPSDMYYFSFRIDSDIVCVKNTLKSDDVSTILKLQRAPEDIENGYLFKNLTKYKARIYVELQTIAEKTTKLDIAFFSKGMYYFDKSFEFEHFAKEKIHYLKLYLEQNHSIVLHDLPEPRTSSLRNFIVDENSGLVGQFGGLSKVGILKIISFIGTIGIAVWMFLAEKTIEGITTLAIILLYLAFDLPSKFGRLRRKE